MTQLLPESAYIHCTDQAHRDRFDELVRSKMDLIPVSPGSYLDAKSDLWTLDEDGVWTDKNGKTRSLEWTPLLGTFGPFQPISDLG